MTTFAIIVAAGSGTRAGGEIPKQYQNIGGKPIIWHTVTALISHPQIKGVVIVIADGHQSLYEHALSTFNLPPPALGGATRQQSVFNGLKALQSINPDKVLIHDAARPFVTAQTISDVIAAIDNENCAMPGIEVVDTIAEVDGNIVAGRLDRNKLRAVQTPQGFSYQTIFNAHKAAADRGDNTATDDSSLVPSVTIVPGDPANIKLTHSHDIKQANTKMTKATLADLPDIRVGHGYDVHAFEQGDHVILCGIKVPFTAKLKGHSDADVAMHALTDAILGALAEGDIGKHFPPSDLQWKGASSDIFLQKTVERIRERGGMLAHSDITIICEAPKLRPHIDQMRARLAEIMDCDIDRVSVKATTSEKLGFTGRSEGIAATATATVRLPA
jgi:2-C-methyl-D-erythritol 4-phosphate cytidylyltransferase/2-C-methyl-D-erythritol 2,4-cyclodiphosphate synthase